MTPTPRRPGTPAVPTLLAVALVAAVAALADDRTKDRPPAAAAGVPRVGLPAAGTVLNVKDPPFGAAGDGVTDDALAINKALAAARKAGEYGTGVQGTVVYLPPGVYRLDAPLDLNGGQYNLVGAGPYQTVLRGNTGDRTAAVEMVGAGFCKVSGLLIDDLVDALPPGQRNPSAVGILLARVDAPQNVGDYAGPRFAAQSYHNYLEDVVIRLGSRPAANGGRGTVAYYNSCSEVSGWHDCYFLADTAAVLSSGNPFGVRMRTARDVEWRPGAPERMRMWAGESSMTVVRASGASGLFGITGPALMVAGASDVSIDACMGHLGHERLPNDPAKWPKYAIEVTGTSHGLAHRGSIEGYAGAVRVVGVPASGLELRSYIAIQPARGPKGEDVDAVPVVMLDSRRVEHPPGSGQFTVVGAALTGSHLAPSPTPDTAGVAGRLIDTSADASHVVQGNHLTLGAMGVRVRNGWPGTLVQGNVATTARPQSALPLDVAGGATRGGNVVAAADGVAADSPVRVGAVPSLPPAGPEHRGAMVRVEGGDGVADRLFICERDAAGTYHWRPL